VHLDYDVDAEPLGHAAMGCSVRKVVHKKSRTAYAMKTFSFKTKAESKYVQCPQHGDVAVETKPYDFEGE
jgi:hypothetical protein